MNEREKLDKLLEEFWIKMDAVTEEIERGHASGRLDGGNPEITEVWEWYKSERKKIQEEYGIES